MSIKNNPPRILTIGVTEPVLETIMHELRLLGYSVHGTTNIAHASAEFDARHFDLITFGGGVAENTRARLKSAFRLQNPAVQLLDVYAPTAVRSAIESVEGYASKAVDLEAYFNRIQYAGSREPTLATLRVVVERHSDAIPFEAIDVLLGKPIDIAVDSLEKKLIRHKRGGYCLEQNPLLQNILQQLGYHVVALSARVLYGQPPGSPIPPRTHAALKVIIDGHPWLVDVGFGGYSPPQPLRLDTTQVQSTNHEQYRIFAFGKEYRVQVQQQGEWLTLYDLDDDPLSGADYEMMNWYTSQYPSSHFRHELLVARTTPTRRYGLRNGKLTVRSQGIVIEQRQLSDSDLAHALDSTFGLNVAPDWDKVLERMKRNSAAESS
jgi:N-hydroxyarylamine O-acetyltransferase